MITLGISKRISILRFTMIVGIVILHVPPYVPLGEIGGGTFAIIKALFSHGIFRSTVPVLTCISGYLLFSSQLWKRYLKLLRNKSATLLGPMIIWNLPLVICLYIIQAYALINHDFSAKLYPFDALVWLNGVFGIFGPPVNYPLNFLRDLFVLSLMAPLFGRILNTMPIAGCLIVSLIFLNNLDGDLILRNTMAINFYIGGMAATMNWKLERLDSFAALLLSVFVIMCFLIVLFKLEDLRWFTVLAPFMLWPASSLIADSRMGNTFSEMAKYSFFIFLSHGIILIAIQLIYSKAFGQVDTPIFWFFASISAVVLPSLTYELLARTAPGLLRFSLGGR